MKKVVVIMLSLALLLAVPSLALALKGGVKPAGPAAFESDLIVSIVSNGLCERVGEIFVRLDGSAKLEFKLPAPVEGDTDFDVYLLCEEGEYGPYTVTVPDGKDEYSYEFPAGTVTFTCTAPLVGVFGDSFEAYSGWCAPVAD